MPGCVGAPGWCDRVSGDDWVSGCLWGLGGLPRPGRSVGLSKQDFVCDCDLPDLCVVCLGATGPRQAMCVLIQGLSVTSTPWRMFVSLSWVPARASVSFPDGALMLGGACVRGTVSEAAVWEP